MQAHHLIQSHQCLMMLNFHREGRPNVKPSCRCPPGTHAPHLRPTYCLDVTALLLHLPTSPLHPSRAWWALAGGAL